MKKLFSLLILNVLFVSNLLADDIAFTINGKPTYSSEVQEVYAKSQQYIDGNSKKTIDQFLDGYILKKIAVEEALKQRIDTTEHYKREISSYKMMLTNLMVKDTITSKHLAQSILDRYEYELELNHLIIPFDTELILPKDTLAHYNKALAFRDEALKIGFDRVDVPKLMNTFGIVVDVESQSGYLGWIRPMMFSFKWDEIIYSLNMNETTMPIRDQKGYHVFQVIGKRPLQGTPIIEQVMFNFPVIPAPERIRDSVYQIAISTYDEITIRNNFQDICNEFAIAHGTGDRGCLLGAIKTGTKIPLTLITEAYRMSRIGEISKPILSDYGYHILRLKDKLDPPSKEQISEFINTHLNTAKIYPEIHRKKWGNMMQQFNGKVNAEAYNKLKKLTDLYNPMDTTFVKKIVNKSDILFTIDNKKEYTVYQFGEYLLDMGWAIGSTNESKQGSRLELVTNYSLSTDVLDENLKNFAFMLLSRYEKETLPDRSPSYTHAINALSDDLLFTTFKEQEVWSKSKTNITALENIYKTNIDKYKLDGEYFKGMIIHSRDEKILKKIESKSKNSALSAQSLKDTYNKKGVIVFIEEGLWKEGENPYVDTKIYKTADKKGQRNFPYFITIGSFITAPQDYTDVRSQVERDYQLLLEKEWANTLKEKYIVEINKNVVNNIK